ncbi:MAG: COG4315 family predicted lipoprotein, partial [Rhodospirillaceae bacterium]
RLERTLSRGVVLATAAGQTLYRRDGYIFQSGGGHSLRRGQQARPAVGRDIGTNARCVSDCGKWHPLTAPKNAQSQGFWTVADRDDGAKQGAKQWVYQGYALWTYDGDKGAGDINGNDAIDYAFANQPDVASATPLQKAFEVGTPPWTVCPPCIGPSRFPRHRGFGARHRRGLGRTFAEVLGRGFAAV